MVNRIPITMETENTIIATNRCFFTLRENKEAGPNAREINDSYKKN